MAYTKSLFIFRRDLRLNDNTGLNKALKLSKNVTPCFIFDPQQVGSENPYRSTNAIRYMVESLIDLNEQLKKQGTHLHLFYGDYSQVLTQLLTKYNFDAVFSNKDYTPFSLKRDEKSEHVCHQHNVAFIQEEDLLLNSPEAIKTASGTPYALFTPFYRASLKIPVEQPQKLSKGKWHSVVLEKESLALLKKMTPPDNQQIHLHGGTSQALTLLKKLPQLKDYAQTHDYPSIRTSNLSATLKFGTLSIRQVYHAIVSALGPDHPLLRQLYWRDFFTHVAYHSPFVFGHAFHEKYDSLPWQNDTKKFQAWCTGTTGFPIVDAGMRQLNTTGFMHNRVRMIVGSFLVKDLHINWQWGEQYFAQQLEDYDPCVNNGNWQWVASTGCDAQPYFRIFNPWLQQKKFDPECIYIKKWVPELQSIEPNRIHNWVKDKQPPIANYPRPIVNHQKESAHAKAMFLRARIHKD